MKSNKPPLLMTPGPTQVPARILKALSRPLIHHREKEFVNLVSDSCERLKKIYKTKNDVFILTSSGTGAMEAAISNCINPGDKVLSLVNGGFSERLANIARAFGADVKSVYFDWGKEVEFNRVSQEFSDDIKLVTMVHNETSTGVRNDVGAISELTKGSNALLAVDTISSLAGDNVETDKWNIDLCISGSQKCFMLPPGLGFISVSEKAWNSISKSATPKFYFDLKKFREKFPDNPWTTPVSLVFALEESLNIIFEEGIEKRIKRHSMVAEYCRSEVKKLGFELFSKPESACSQTLTSVTAGKNKINLEKMRSILKQKYRIQIAGGQKHLKGKIFRIGHMGAIGKKEVNLAVNSISKILKQLEK